MHWGKSTWDVPNRQKNIGHTDDEEAFAKYVLTDYCAVGGGSPPLLDIQDDRYYWSAVGISAIMKGAGVQKTEFPFAQSHSVFIRQTSSRLRRAEERAAGRLGASRGRVRKSTSKLVT